jgi:L-Ala-D/L-Glu epimerase
VSTMTNLLIRIHTSAGIVGLGAAAPDLHVTGETPDPAHRLIADVVDPLLRGTDPLRPVRRMHALRTALDAWPSVQSGIDIALFDIMGKFAGLPLFKLLGGYRDRMMTSITIGILNEGDTVRVALEHVRDGFRALKIKGGQNVDDDIEKTLRVRDAVGPKIALRFDANQGYQLDDAVRFVAATRDAALEVLEQPTPKGALELLGSVTEKVPIPVMADECLLNLRDALKLAKRGLADMVNIKLMKVGGIREASAINAVARAAGLEAMVGCMDELALGIAAGLAFACGRPNVVFADLDGHIGLLGDPTAAAVTLKNGVLYPSRRPGLGLTM